MRSYISAATASGLLSVVLCTAPVGSAAGFTPFAPSTCGYSTIGGKLYRCTFDDEFNGSSLNRGNWTVNTGFVTGSAAAYACTVDDPRYISVSGGALHLTAERTASPVPCNGASPTPYEAPTISTWHLFSQQYGRFEARLRTTVATTPGLQESFWLWPDDRYSAINWPASGEIDIAETFSQYPNTAVPYLHYGTNDNGGPVPGLNTSWNCAAQRGVFNTYTLTWTPTSIKVDINGATCLVNTSGAAAFKKRYIIALSQALGSGTNSLDAATKLPATTDVDYVRVWQGM